MLTVRYFAGARAAAGGIRDEQVAAQTVNELITDLAARHGESLAVVLKAATFLVDGLTCHDPNGVLPVIATIDILPPFAGG